MFLINIKLLIYKRNFMVLYTVYNLKNCDWPTYLQSICKKVKELEFFNIQNYNFKFYEKNQLFLKLFSKIKHQLFI